MNRTELQKLAEMRIREAKALLNAGEFAGTYYLTGYAVECAIKSCIARQTKEHDFPPDPDYVRKIYVHNLPVLLSKISVETKDAFDRERKANSDFDSNWAVAKDWSEQSRYTVGTTEQQARALFDAVSNPKHGILPWLMKQW